MDTKSVRCLINSVSRFIHLVSSQNLKLIPTQKDYRNIVSSLKLLKPVLDEVADYKISAEEILFKECEELDVAINEAREFMESWCPKMSKISCVLRSEPLVMKIQSSSLEICCTLERLLRSSPSTSSLSGVHHCMQELQCLEQERISEHIEESLRSQRNGAVPCSDHLLKIVESLSLTSGNELLKESVALEHERMKTQVNKRKGELDRINQIVDLFCHIRSFLVKLDHFKAINGVPIPPYFRCPLSLELMVDPVIVASGQTYERASIQKWLDHGLTICPKTHQLLAHTNLIPNYTVKALIASWCEENNIRLSNTSECTNIILVPPLNHEPPQNFIHTDSFCCSLHGNSTSISSMEVGNGFEKQKVDASSRFDEFEKQKVDASSRFDEFEKRKVNANSRFDEFEKRKINTSSRFDEFEKQKVDASSRFDEFGKQKVDASSRFDGFEKRKVNASSRFDEFEKRKVDASSRFDEFEKQDAFPRFDEFEKQKVDASSRFDEFEKPKFDAASRFDEFEKRKVDVTSRFDEFEKRKVDASSRFDEFEKQRVNASSRFDEEASDVHKSRDTEKFDHSSPDQSYVHSRSESATSAISSIDYMPNASTEVSGISNKNENTSELSGEITFERPISSSNKDLGFSPWPSGKQFHGSKRTEIPSNGSHSYPGTLSLPFSDPTSDDLTTTSHVEQLVEDLKSQSNEVQTTAAAELRLLAKHNMENRIIIGHCGAIPPLVSLLYSEVKQTQEHAVTALLNLSINEDNKAMIAEAGAIEPLIHVLKSGNAGAKENSAAALFSLSVLQEYKAKIGRSGAVKALVALLGSGTLRGKKDAATALFNLSIFHENKARIVQAGAVKYLVELMDPTTGMVDKAVALLANLSTISEGRLSIAREGAIPLLVEVVETGSQRGKENAASILLQLCINSAKYCTLVLQEGAVPPLVALSQSGTPRAKEKAQQLLGHFRTQREGANGKKK